MKKIDNIFKTASGQWRITITFRNKQYSAKTNNSLAIDRYNDKDSPPRRKLGFYTLAWSAKILYNEVKRANGL